MRSLSAASFGPSVLEGIKGMQSSLKVRIWATAGVSALALSNFAAAQDAPIVQPGAPGQAARALEAEEASKIADTSYSAYDVEFMQDMIAHHQQAVDMAALVKDRTNSKDIVAIAGRIDVSQEDEIKFMRDWLETRGETAPDPKSHHEMHGSRKMAGMATPKQMAALGASNAAEFDRQFLTLMIEHHKGAVKMVKELLERPGSAYDPPLFEFISEVSNGQTAEIERMNVTLAGLTTDGRVGLKAGFTDPAEAIRNLEKIATLAKPDGFFDPKNPAGIAPPKPKKGDDAKSGGRGDNADTKTELSERSPLLSFANTDIAFSNDMMIAGNYHGFNIYDLDAEGLPSLVSSVVCPGGQGDVSIVGDLLITSVEQTRGRVDCGLQGVSEDVSKDRFRGIRIFDISDPTRPVQVGQVQTCRGSHTHSVVSGPGKDGMIIVYNSGTSSIRDEKELDGCVGDVPGDDRTALFRIDVIEIPVDDPSQAKIIDSPAVFADPKSGRLAGLWQGGDHGDDTQETSRTDQCHDITVFPSAKIAAGACSGNGVIFDISNPRKPKRIDEVSDPGFAYWHSATFNNDGTKVLYTDEWGGGSRPRCRAYDPKEWGANAIYDIVDGKLKFGGYYKLPAPQAEEENCVAHNGSIIPVPGRDIFVQSWYQGGVSVIDFTDSSKPVEIAYFDRGPINKDHLVMGGYWSSYWYRGRIYATEIARGIDVFKLTPSDYLSANEIAAAELADQGGLFNPQQQFPVSWPDEPVIARAYIDQLKRSDALSTDEIADLEAALDAADKTLRSGAVDTSLAKRFQSLASGVIAADDAAGRKKRAMLSETLGAIAKRVR